MDKLKPDQITFAVSGEKMEVFSKEKFESKKKAEETYARLERAFEQAITGESFDKLRELMKN